jgi:hypothetical protein
MDQWGIFERIANSADAGCKSGRARVPARREEASNPKPYSRLPHETVLNFDNNGSRGRDPSPNVERESQYQYEATSPE